MSVDELWALHVKTGQILAARLKPERQSWRRGSNKSVNALLQKIKSRSLLLSGGVGGAGGAVVDGRSGVSARAAAVLQSSGTRWRWWLQLSRPAKWRYRSTKAETVTFAVIEQNVPCWPMPKLSWPLPRDDPKEGRDGARTLD
jgi:hypothetical protein